MTDSSDHEPKPADEPVSLADLETDRVAKQDIVKTAIYDYLSKEENCEHPDTKLFGQRLRSGEAKLQVINLSGGYTNYTYKVSCVGGSDDDNDNNTTTPLHMFVKLCFPRAFWNPDPTYVYDVDRIANEAMMMEHFAMIAPGCVARPFFLLDIDDMKLLAAEWSSKADEQLGNQFIDGVADERVAAKLSKAIADFHCSEMEETFNTEARECMIDVFPSIQEKMLKMAEEGRQQAGEDSNRAKKEVGKLGGKDKIEALWQTIAESYRSSEIPCHADLHAFNILIEAKPDVSALERFGSEGHVVICDWEMAMVGPLGLDLGRLYSIPLTCILAHALNRNYIVAERFLDYMTVIWNEYSSEMKASGGKDDAFLVKCYRSALAWMSWKVFAMAVNGWFVPFMPVEGKDIDRLKESLVIIALKGIQFFDGDYMPELSIDQLQSRFYDSVEAEVDHIRMAKAAVRTQRAPALMRSSILRTQNRRVSDAFTSLRASQGLSASIIAALEG